MKRTVLILLLMASLSVPGIVCSGQVTDTQIRGVVTLPDSVPAIGSKVIARHVPSGTLYAAIADTTGAYLIPSVPIGGPYSLKVTLPGFEPFIKPDIYLTLKIYTLDVRLQQKSGGKEKSRSKKHRYP